MLEDSEYTQNNIYSEYDEISKHFISIYGGNINLFSKGSGLNSKGNIFIHGGNINIFSENQDKMSIKHLGNFTLFDSTIICVGTQASKQIHEEILKGNQFYAFCNENIDGNKILKIKNEINNIIKEISITKNINYIFFSSLDLNEKYSFYIADKNGYNEEKYNFTIKRLENGKDDQDIFPDDDYNDEDNNDNDNDNKKDNENEDQDKKGLKGWEIALIVIASIIVFIILALFLYIIIRHNCC